MRRGSRGLPLSQVQAIDLVHIDAAEARKILHQLPGLARAAPAVRRLCPLRLLCSRLASESGGQRRARTPEHLINADVFAGDPGRFPGMCG
jgi:hypothetical protein